MGTLTLFGVIVGAIVAGELIGDLIRHIIVKIYIAHRLKTINKQLDSMLADLQQDRQDQAAREEMDFSDFDEESFNKMFISKKKPTNH